MHSATHLGEKEKRCGKNDFRSLDTNGEFGVRTSSSNLSKSFVARSTGTIGKRIASIYNREKENVINAIVH